MSQVSNRKVKESDWGSVWSLFNQVVGEVSGKDSEVLIHGLLTETERIMLAKRFVSSLLLLHGNEPNQIQDRLKMSKATIYKNKLLLSLHPNYKKLILRLFPKKVKLKEDQTKEASVLETILEDILQGRRQRSRLHPTGYSRK